MSTILQHRRGTTAEHSTFTGAVGELTVDTTKDTVVVHDGSTAGGYPLVTENTTQTISGTKTFSANPVLSGGTANGVLYLNGSKVATSGSALTFDGSTLTNTGALSIQGNTTLGNASTDTVTVNGRVGIGDTGLPHLGLFVSSSAVLGGRSFAVASLRAGGTLGSDVTGQGSGLIAKINTEAASFTLSNASGVSVDDASKGAGSTITNLHGLYINDQTAGTNNYGITSLVSSGANKWNIYASGTAKNYFAGQVGIGTASPYTDTQLQINAGNQALEISINNAVADTVRMFAYDRTAGTTKNLQLRGVTTSILSSATELFTVGTTGVVVNETGIDADFRVESDTNTHALFVDGGNSRVGINSSSPANAFAVIANAADTTTVSGTTIQGIAGFAPSTLVGNLFIGGTGAADADVYIGSSYTTGDLVFFTRQAPNNNEVVRITDTKYVRLASGTGGIQFNGDTAAANALDDYEEGTFTPTIEGTTTAGTGTYTAQVGRYTKIGDRVMYMINLSWSAHTGTGSLRVAGLPFTTESTSNNNNIPAVYNANITMTAGNVMQSYISNNSTVIQLRQLPTGGGADAAIPMDTAGQVVFSGQYEV